MVGNPKKQRPSSLTGCRSHADELSKNPRVDVEKVRNTVFLHEFDRCDTSSGYFVALIDWNRELQCPTWGYPKCEVSRPKSTFFRI